LRDACSLQALVKLRPASQSLCMQHDNQTSRIARGRNAMHA